MKLAFVAIRNSHSKRRRLCVVVAVSRRGFVAGSRLPPRRLLACPVAFVAVNNIHPWIIVGQSTGESIVPLPFPLLFCHRSFFHRLSRIRATISNVQLVLVSRETFSFSFFFFLSTMLLDRGRKYRVEADEIDSVQFSR